MDDFDLLQAYASGFDEAAFAVLTERYLNLVYSAAVRQTSDTQTAEDLTQAVFLMLARKAGSISRETILPGWLLRTTRFAAANARRLQQRRRNYEREAMQHFLDTAQSDQTWQQIGPLLDEALDQLGEEDRNAVVLRFFQQNSFKLVGQKLGTTEDTAQKRVSRAVEKLRIFLGRHGRTISATGLASALAANSVQAAPNGLNSLILAGLAGGTASSAAFTLAKLTAEAIGHARFRILTLRWSGLTLSIGLVLLLLFRMLIAHQVPKASDPRPAVSSSSKPQREATLGFDTLPTNKEGQSLLLHIVDAQTADPIGNVLLTLISRDASPIPTTNTFVTDAQGASSILYSTNVRKSWSHRIEVFRDGYVPKFLSWSDYQQDRIEEIPADYTLKLTPAVAIGGTVVDEQDAPVTDLRVVFSLSGPIPSHSRERVTMMGDYHTEMTDAAGHWSCNHVPPRFGMIAYRLVHPLFQEKLYACDSPDELGYVGIEKISEQDFLTQRALMRVKPGIIIAGTVTDENKQPIAGAKVSQGYDFHSSERNVLTEADGAFRFANARPGNLALTFQANGFAPEVISLQLSTNVETLQIVLPAGRNLLGRITDESGQPIRGARIEAASPTEDSRTLFEWHTKTDDDGRFSWDLAPTSQDYAIEASGYQSLPHITLVADGLEHIVKLTREGVSAVRILGQVLDAETRLAPPSPKIQLWETTRDPSGSFSTFTTTAESLPADGQFRLSTSAGTVSYILEANGDGYSPKRVTNEVSGSVEIHVTMELIKAASAGGIVLMPSGEPAAGAMLAVCGPQQWVQMHEAGKLQIGSQSQAVGTVADAQGHFKLPAKYAADFVAVAHPSGFAELPLSTIGSNTTITLHPYGRITGSVRLGGKASSRETVRLENMLGTRSRVSLYLSARTDDDGSFQFDSVPAGEWLVQREVNVRAEAQAGIHIAAYSHGVPVIVRSGETSQAALGGNGRPVLGKVIPPGPGADIPWADYVVSLSLKVAAPNAPQQPVRADFESDEAFQTGQRDFAKQNLAFWTSEPGRTAQRLKRQYSAVFGTDGSFRIDDVPPGDYSLKIQPVNLPRKPAPNLSKVPTLASFEIDATIPVAPNESENSAVNLGDLQLSVPMPTQRVSSN